MSKNCTLYTVIDLEGITSYYAKTSNLKIYDADSFFNIICDDAPFVGPTNQILLLEPDVNYTWQMNEVNNLDPEVKPTLPTIVNFEFSWLGNGPVDWDMVFDVAGSGFTPQGSKLVCKKFNNSAVTIRTKKKLYDNVPDLRLSYSIQFQFKIGSNTVIGSIDPLIKNRNND